MKNTTWMLCGIVALMLALCSGCVVLAVGGAAAAGAGSMAYVQGELQATVDASMERAWSASQKALKELQMPVTDEDKDALSGKLTARASGDKKVVVRVKKVTATATELGIRVGIWGDETKAHEILEAIKRRL
jgi:hypothetical protein